MLSASNRLMRSISRGLAVWRRRPFPRLVTHFLRRISRDGGENAAGEVEIGAGPLLGLIATPGAFASLLLLEKYSSLLNWFRSRPDQDLLAISLPDKLLFIAVSMALTGAATVLRWDRILPDAQDFTNLAHLPLRPRTFLAANIVAIAFSAGIIALFANAASSLLFPVFVSAASPDNSISVGTFVVAHAVSVVLASVFTFFLVLAVMGIVPESLTSVTRAVLLILSIGLVPAVLTSARSAGQALFDNPASLYLPPVWFLAFYETLLHRSTSSAAPLATFAVTGLLAMFLAAVVAYGISYRRRFRAVAESARGRQGAGSFSSVFLRALDFSLSWKSAFDRAIGGFIGRGLLRNPLQRLILLVALGLGWLFALRFVAVNSAACLAPAYLLVLGLRIACSLPASLSANSVFRLLLENSVHSARNAVRHVAAVTVLLLVVLPAGVALLAHGYSPSVMAMQLALLVMISLLHIQALCYNAHRIPFTAPFPPFRQNLPVRCFVHTLAFIFVMWAGASFQNLLQRRPAFVLFLFIAAVALTWWSESNYRRQRDSGDPEVMLSFESHDPASLQLPKFN